MNLTQKSVIWSGLPPSVLGGYENTNQEFHCNEKMRTENWFITSFLFLLYLFLFLGNIYIQYIYIFFLLILQMLWQYKCTIKLNWNWIESPSLYFCNMTHQKQNKIKKILKIFFFLISFISMNSPLFSIIQKVFKGVICRC